MSSHPKRSHLIGLACLGMIAFATIAGRLVFLQGFQRGAWRTEALREHERKASVAPARGTIYDRRGRVLAVNMDVPSVYADPSAIRNPPAVVRTLAPILPDTPRTLTRKLNSKKQFVWLARGVDPAQADAVRKKEIEGVGLRMESRRFYPRRELLGHALGFAGLDNHGLEGIEKQYDALLRGEAQNGVMERDAHGVPVFPKGFEYAPLPRGSDVHLTVDEVIQYISERELARGVEAAGARGGVAIVMAPQTGEILALAVHPRFNPNAAERSLPSAWRNRAVTDAYEPGSTFKIVTAAAALEEGVVLEEEAIDCEAGSYRVPGTGGAVIHDHLPVGRVSFRDVIARSSNIGTVKVAQRLRPERLASYIRGFGFGNTLGLDVIGEAAGLVRPVQAWSGRSLASVAIGQEVSVTPLQMVAAMSALANGGQLMTPHFIRQETPEPDAPQALHLLRTAHASEVLPSQGLQGASPLRRVVSEVTARRMSRILEEVVLSGTGVRAAIPGYSVAGKTGTAQKVDPDTGRYSEDRYIASFVGFAPASAPAMTILVVIDEPQGVSWGGTVAAPVFSAIGREVLHYLKIRPEVAPVESKPTEAVRVAATRTF